MNEQITDAMLSAWIKEVKADCAQYGDTAHPETIARYVADKVLQAAHARYAGSESEAVAVSKDVVYAAIECLFRWGNDFDCAATIQLLKRAVSDADSQKKRCEQNLFPSQSQLPAPDGWQFERVGNDTIKVMWGGSGVVVNKDGTIAKAVAALALYELADAMLTQATKESDK